MSILLPSLLTMIGCSTSHWILYKVLFILIILSDKLYG